MDVQEAKELILDLIDEHGYSHFEVLWTNDKRTLGWYWEGRQQFGFSIPAIKVNCEETIRDTALHEIAHAMSPPEWVRTRGRKNGGYWDRHGKAWQATAARLGAHPRHAQPNAVAVPGRYQGVCPQGHKFTRHRRNTDGYRYCGPCGINERGLITWYDTKTKESFN